MKDWAPIGHCPPMPRIETSPRYTPAPPEMIPDYLRQQIESLQELTRAIEAARIWQTVIDAARTA